MPSRSVGVRIYTGTSISDATAGLFDGVFWFVDAAITTSNPWKAGFVPENSLGDVDQSIDLRSGGNVAQHGGFSVILANADPIIRKVLDDNGIVLTNKYSELVEINTDTNNERIIAVGVCDEIKWNSTDLLLEIRDVDAVADVSVTKSLSEEDYPNIDDDMKGAIIPVTYGSIDRAKLVSISEKEIALTADDLWPGLNPGNGTAFMVWAPSNDTPTLTYYVFLGTTYGHPNAADFDKARFIGKYIKPIAGQSQEEYREIVDASIYSGTETIAKNRTVILKINTYFTNTLRGDSKGKDAKQTWISVVSCKKAFIGDIRTCLGFNDASGASTITNPDLAVFSSEQKGKDSTSLVVIEKTFKFRRIPNFIVSVNADHNRLVFKQKSFVKNPDTVESMLIYPPAGVYALDDRPYSAYNASKPYLYAGSVLSHWGYDAGSESDFSKYLFKAIGLYVKSSDYFPAAGDYTMAVNNLANAIDKVWNTCAELRLTSNINHAGDSTWLVIGMIVEPPKLSDDFDFDSVHLLIRAGASATPAFFKRLEVHIRHINWAGYSKEILPQTIGNAAWASPGITSVLDMFDDYDGGVDADQFYYRTTPNPPTASLQLISGYKNFTLSGVNSIDAFNALLRCAVLFKFHVGDPWNVGNFARAFVNEVAFGFIKSLSIKKELFAAFDGRTFGGSWGGRKTSSALITNPVDACEDLDRHKNTSYRTNRRFDWGIELNTDALVNTGNEEGGYDSSILSSPKCQIIAFQRFSDGDCHAVAIQKLLCSEHFLAKYRDGRGRECITYIAEPVGVAAISRKITLSDVPAETTVGDVEECSSEDITSGTIIVRYNQNYGDDSFSGIITITHIYEYAYNSSYVTGYDGGMKQSLWELAHARWQRFGDSTSKKEMTLDLLTVRDESSAVWILQRHLLWQGKRRIAVPVYYDKARKWNLCDRVTLTLPHQTDGVEVECIIEKKKEIRTRGVTELSLVMFWEAGMSLGAEPVGVAAISRKITLSDVPAETTVGDVEECSSEDITSGTIIVRYNQNYGSGSKSSSSYSTSCVSDSSISDSSESESSESSTIGIARDHVHISLWNPQVTTEIVKTNTNGFFGVGELDAKHKEHVCITDAQTNIISYPLRLDHQLSTGNIDVGFGVGVCLRTRKTGEHTSCEIGRMTWDYSTANTDSNVGMWLRSGNTIREVLRIDATTKIWLDPTSGVDTNLYRDSASVLKTDHNLRVATALGVGSRTPSVTGRLECEEFGVGSGVATATVPVYLRKDQNAHTELYVHNATNGNDSATAVRLYHGISNYLALVNGAPLQAFGALGLTDLGMSGMYCVNTSGTAIGNVSNTPLYLGTNNTVRTTITAAGNIEHLGALGVGSSTPTTAGRIQCSEALGVGAAPTAQVIGYFKKDQDDVSYTAVENKNNHAGAYTAAGVYADDTNSLVLIQASTLRNLGHAGLTDLGLSEIYARNVNGLLINNYSNTWTKFATNNTIRMTIAADGIISVTRQDTIAEMGLYGIGDGASYYGRIDLLHARGTIASPSAIASGDAIGRVNFWGRDGSGWKVGGSLRAKADASWSGATDAPTLLELWACANASDTETRVAWFGASAAACLVAFSCDSLTVTNGATLKVFSQAAQPSGADLVAGQAAFWIDTDDSDKLYLIYNQSGTYKKVQLT